MKITISNNEMNVAVESEAETCFELVELLASALLAFGFCQYNINESMQEYAELNNMKEVC